MSIIPQQVRFAAPGKGPSDNPNGIIQDLKPTRLISGAGPPQPTDGEEAWQYMDATAGVLYLKTGGVWAPLIDYVQIISPNLPPPTLPDDVQFDSISNKNSDNLLVQAADTLTLQSANLLAGGDTGSYNGVNSVVLGSVSGTASVQALQGVNVSSAAAGVDIEAGGAGSPVTLSSPSGAIVVSSRQISAALAPGGSPSVISSPAGMTVGGSSSTIEMLGAGVSITTPPAQGATFNTPVGVTIALGGLKMTNTPISNCSGINGSLANLAYRSIGTDASGVLSGSRRYESTFEGSFQSPLPATGTQYWASPGTISPAEYWAVPVINAGPAPRALTGVALYFLTNAPFSITAGSLQLEVGYVGPNAIVTSGTFVSMWISSVIPTGVGQPFVVAEGELGFIPAGACVAVRLVGSGVTYSAPGVDAAVCVSVN